MKVEKNIFLLEQTFTVTDGWVIPDI